MTLRWIRKRRQRWHAHVNRINDDDMMQNIMMRRIVNVQIQEKETIDGNNRVDPYNKMKKKKLETQDKTVS